MAVPPRPKLLSTAAQHWPQTRYVKCILMPHGQLSPPIRIMHKYTATIVLVIVSKYRKQELKNALETYVSIRRGQNKARIFDNNMQILERCYRTIETMPPETLLYNATMRQFNILANYLEQLLEEYN